MGEIAQGEMTAEDIEAAAEGEPAVAGSHAEGAHPWRRYFARMLDNMVNTFTFFIVLMVALAFTRPELFNALVTWLESIHRIADLMLTIFIGTVVNAVLLAATGSTLGKWIFGIRVREADGRRIGFARAIEREARVWMRGLAFGIPIVSLFTLVRAYNQVNDFKQTAWDKDMQLVVTHRPPSVGQHILWTLAVLAWIGFMALSVIPA